MTEAATQTPPSPRKTTPERVVNDFSIHVATKNGSGSQSSNLVLIRALFQMGIPICGKNLFPSNIQGLPTWYTIRVSKDGYIARRENSEIVVAMNQDTVIDDVREMRAGDVLVYNTDLKFTPREDLIQYAVPYAQIVKAVCPEVRLRKMVQNMIYVGVLAELLGFDIEEIKKALHKQFKGKSKAIEINWAAIQAGIDYAKEKLPKQDPYRVERMNKTQGKILIEGNAASAIGAMFAGATICTWYPITPSSSLGETFTDLVEAYRKDPATGKATFAVVQAEDELAAVGMALGAGWAGARSMTTTSGPGISLMAEFVGFGYYAEIPTVIFDVQRVGPSTGLPTRTMQGDVRFAAQLSHGDTKHIVLLPGFAEECYSMAVDAFQLAEQFQTPVFVLSDLDLGMNNWMADPFQYPAEPIKRGKVLSAEDLDKVKEFARYRDVDGDGIPYRTLPGTKHPLAAYFTRGSGHGERASYSEDATVYKNMVDRLSRKYDTARKFVPAPEFSADGNSEVGVIAFGSTHCAMLEARDQLREEAVAFDYLRLRAIPFSDSVKEFIAKHKRVYVVEQNRDAQMAGLLKAEYAEHAPKLRSILHYNGLPVPARFIANAILEQERKGLARKATT